MSKLFPCRGTSFSLFQESRPNAEPAVHVLYNAVTCAVVVAFEICVRCSHWKIRIGQTSEFAETQTSLVPSAEPLLEVTKSAFT